MVIFWVNRGRLDGPLIFARLCILPGQSKSFHIFIDTIPPCLPWHQPTMSSSTSCHHVFLDASPPCLPHLPRCQLTMSSLMPSHHVFSAPSHHVFLGAIPPCLPRHYPTLSSSTPSHHVFLGHLLDLVPFMSIIITHLIQSVSSLHSTCPNKPPQSIVRPYPLYIHMWCTCIFSDNKIRIICVRKNDVR